MIKTNLKEKIFESGIDIGSSEIKCTIVEIDSINESVKLIGIGRSQTKGLKKGSISNREKLIDEIEASINAAELMANRKIDKINLGISGEFVKGINTQGAITIGNNINNNSINGNTITENDVKNVLDLTKAISLPIDQDILHVIPQEFKIDSMNSIKEPVGMTGRRLEAMVHLITVTSAAIDNLVKCIEELGIEVSEVIYQGLASSLSTLYEDEKELGVACVDIGSTKTDIIIYCDGGIKFTSTINIGSNSITNDIAVMLQIPISKSEEIKKKYTSAKANLSSDELRFEIPSMEGQVKRSISENEVSKYVEARMIEILDIIKNECEQSGLKEKLTYGIVFTGGGSSLKNFEKLAKEVLDMPIRIGCPQNISGAVEQATTPSYAVALGLAQWKIFKKQIVNIDDEKPIFKNTMKKIKSIIKEFF